MKLRHTARAMAHEVLTRFGMRERRPDRVDLDDNCLVDDVFFTRPQSVHLERMSHRHWWACIQAEDGEDVMLDWFLVRDEAERKEGKRRKKGLHLRVEGGPKQTPPKEAA